MTKQNMPWFRMYSDFLNDPKMISLAFEDQRHFIGVLALKGEGTLDNECPPELLTRIVAQRLWIDHAVVGEVKKRLVAAGLIDDNWQPLAWEKRQMRSDSSTERVRAHREKAKQASNGDETLPQRSSNALDKKREEEIREEEKNKPARHAPRVALHAELRNLELPDGIAADVWGMWCEHREAKTKDAPWTSAAAKVSIKRLVKLLAEGQAPEVTVEEAVLRGWTGLFPVKASSAAAGAASTAAPDGWWKSESGIGQRAQQLGVERKPGQLLEQFKAKVFKAAGPGEWMEDMLRTVGRESEERYEQLYAYFNDIPREQARAEVEAV